MVTTTAVWIELWSFRPPVYEYGSATAVSGSSGISHTRHTWLVVLSLKLGHWPGRGVVEAQHGNSSE